MAKKLENLNKKELLKLAIERKVELPPRAKKREILALLKKPKIEQVETEPAIPVPPEGMQVKHPTEEEPELSETSVIKGEQATAPAPTATATITPGAESQAEPIPEGAILVICDGCKRSIERNTAQHCPDCKLYFCETCSVAGTCHKCGKALK